MVSGEELNLNLRCHTWQAVIPVTNLNYTLSVKNITMYTSNGYK